MSRTKKPQPVGVCKPCRTGEHKAARPTRHTTTGGGANPAAPQGVDKPRGTRRALLGGMAGRLVARGLVGVGGPVPPARRSAGPVEVHMVAMGSRPAPMTLERARQLVAKDRERRRKAASRRREALREAKALVAKADKKA